MKIIFIIKLIMSESVNLDNNYGVVRTYHDPPYNTKLYEQ